METFYSKEFSLSDMPTWDYITDPRFEVIGVSVKVNDTPAVSFSGTLQETSEFLRRFDWANSLAVCHNAAFDLSILKWVFGISPKARACTWSMCNALHGVEGSTSLAKMAQRYDCGVKGTDREAALGFRRADFTEAHLNSYMAYCRQDSDITYNLFHRLMQDGFPERELRIIDLTMSMYTEGGLTLNKELIADELASVRARHTAAWQAAGITDPALLRQDEVLADMLVKFGVDPPRKVTAKGNSKYAFAKGDLEFLELREHEDDRIVALVDARLEAKSSIEETRLVSLSRLAERFRAIPFPLTYFGASTGRWSAWDDINMQNLPKKGRIRECITAPPGHVIVGADLSQIELRILAWLAGQWSTLDELETGDTYSSMATRIYGRPINKRDHPTERFVGKSTVLGGGFRAGWRKLMSVILADAKRYGIVLPDTGEAFFQNLVHVYRMANPKVVQLWGEAERAIDRMLVGGNGYVGVVEHIGNKVLLPRGIPMVYYNIRKELDEQYGKVETVYDRFNFKKRKSARVRLWSGLLVENIVQALARDVLANCALTALDMGYRAVGTVHDELLFVVPADRATQAMEDIKRAMTTPPDWLTDCPLDCEIHFGDNYAEVK
jgi:DNA polymerase